ncbi:hypothetical protein GWK08_16475 [Leptobacterium flavescens]|uniref:Lipoprotein n=1 Tax=Leptobacterium flavescens TaxID=472055 RepID=A0A6P0UR91_9FLAO|nr:hypothetical protein [Leptobacterium flavescens]NER15052.1 hypothetical protein [Leptobacterium flavescens]
MIKVKTIIPVLISFMVLSCKSEKHEFPLEKRFWDVNDYRTITLELNYGYEDDEKLPSISDPETRIIVEKLTDHQNYEIVLNDEELGLKHRNKVADEFFDRWKDMNNVYRIRDVQDKYLYDIELLKVWHFGLGLQLRYFKLGNDNILASSDDPNSTITQNRLNFNVKTLIGNYNIYLDETINEEAFSDKGKTLFAEGIDIYFSQLIELYPDADFSEMERKIDLMNAKSNHGKIKESLSKIKSLIESKKIRNNYSK